MERCGSSATSCIFLLLLMVFFQPISCTTTPTPLCPCLLPADVNQAKPLTVQFVTNYNNCGEWHQNASKEDKWYSIKTAASELVVDASYLNHMKIQEFTGSPRQLWKFEPADRPGVYYIVNKQTGLVLDYIVDSLAIVLKEKDGSLNQQWILNSNGRIFNVGRKYNIDVQNANYSPGVLLHVWKDNGNQAQEFTLQEKSK